MYQVDVGLCLHLIIGMDVSGITVSALPRPDAALQSVSGSSQIKHTKTCGHFGENQEIL